MASVYGVQRVCISSQFRIFAEGNVPDELLLATLDKLELPVETVYRGEDFDLGGGAVINVLWPDPGCDMDVNNTGLVLRLRFANRTVLFPADIQDPAMKGLLTSPDQLAADVLVAAHHGSSEKSTPAFLKAVHPQFIVSSNAARLTGKQRRFDTMAGKTPLYRTNKCGAITITIKSSGAISVSTFLRPEQK